MSRIRIHVVASIILFSASVHGASPDLNQHGLTGSWYDPAKTGQGIELEVFPDLVASGTSLVQGAWFTFDSAPVGASDRERWYTFNGNGQSGSASVPVTIYQNVGGNFDALPITQPTAVGSGTLAFSDCSNGTLSYNFTDSSGRTGSTPLTRLTPNVTCATDTAPGTDADFALSGNWFAPATSGQGVVLELNPGSQSLLLTWYTYAPAGQSMGPSGQRWFVGLQKPYVPGTRSFALQLYETTGGLFDQPTNPAPSSEPVGTANLAFASYAAAQLDYAFTGGSSAGKSGSIGLVRVGPVPPGSAAPAGGPATSATSFRGCVEALNAQDGGWCQIGSVKFMDVAVTSAQADAIDKLINAGNGSRSVIEAWNSMAYSPDDRATYFCANGGHNDWAGNECYAFYLDQAKWERLTQPSAYPPGTNLATAGYPMPISGPPSTHTYDGVWYYPPTKTVMVIPGSAFPGGDSFFGKQLWEFNPSKVDSRNGLAPLTWRKVTDDTKMTTSFARSAVLPDGNIYVGSSGLSWVYDPRKSATTALASMGDWGTGSSTYDRTRNVVWHVIADHLFRSAVPVVTSPQDLGAMPAFAGNGVSIDGQGRVFAWNGGANVVRYEPETNKWFGYLHASGPDGGRPYGKFVFVEPENVFVGISEAYSSMWVYRPPSGPGSPMTTASAQAFVDKAAAGSSVVVPPGIYAGGLRLNKPLTINLKGVVLTSVIDAKGFVLVDNTPGPVVIEDFETLLPPHTGTNASGIRIQGGGDVTVRRAHIANSEMGIETGNEGTGKLTIEDSVVEGMRGGSDLSHAIYAGFSDTLTVRRTTVRDVKGLGHLVKSRARTTTIDQSYLLGLNGRDSREFEAPNGGRISITHSVIQKGPNTDNAESMMVGGEIAQADPAMVYLPSSFTFTDNWVIFDRMQLQPEPAWQAGQNQFGKYRNMPPTWLNVPAPPAPVIQRNKFVNMTNPGEFPPFDSTNTFFPTRAAAGLGATGIPPVR